MAEGSGLARPDDQRIVWMRQLIEWVQEMQEPSEFLSTLRVDLYPEEVYTFTPKGRVVVLPRGATPVDFAYAVHTEVGHQCARRKSEWRDGSAAPRAGQWRRGRNPHAERPRAIARLAVFRAHLARPQQNPAMDHLHEREEATEVGRRLLEKEARKPASR